MTGSRIPLLSRSGWALLAALPFAALGGALLAGGPLASGEADDGGVRPGAPPGFEEFAECMEGAGYPPAGLHRHPRVLPAPLPRAEAREEIPLPPPRGLHHRRGEIPLPLPPRAPGHRGDVMLAPHPAGPSDEGGRGEVLPAPSPEVREECAEELPPRPDPDELEARLERHADCLREHGVDIPDLRRTDHGITLRIGPSAMASEAFQEAARECGRFGPPAPAPIP